MSLPAESSPRSRTWPANLNDTSVSTIALPSPSSGPTATPLTASALIPFHMLQATSVARCAQRSASVAFAIDAHRGAGASAPEWTTLIPAANFKGFDGRGPYRLDQPAHVVAATEEIIA